MEQNYPAYRAIRMDTWPRREHFAYYRHQIRCGYSLTVRMDVTKLAAFTETKHLHFFPCFLYAASRTVNQMDEMKMMLTPDGGVGIWEVSHPNFTIFHEDDKTFSDVWMQYQPDFSAFYQEYLDLIQQSDTSYDSPELMLFTIIELISSTSYSCILYSQPVSLDEYRPYLHRTIDCILQAFSCPAEE